MAKGKDAKTDETGDATRSGSKLPTVLAIVNLALTLALAGAVVWMMLREPEAEAAQVVTAADGEGAELPPAPAASYKFTPFVVNLMDSANIRYVKVEMELELSDEGVREELEERDAQFRDMVISVLSNRTYGELLGVRGKTQLREELLRRMNQSLTEGTVDRIYFVDFVVQ